MMVSGAPSTLFFSEEIEAAATAMPCFCSQPW
jgi:hypothetical protein